MIGIAVSLATMVGVRLFTPLAWTWYVVTGAGICVAVGLLASGAPKAARRVERT